MMCPPVAFLGDAHCSAAELLREIDLMVLRAVAHEHQREWWNRRASGAADGLSGSETHQLPGKSQRIRAVLSRWISLALNHPAIQRLGAENRFANATTCGGTSTACRAISCSLSPASGSMSVPLFATSASSAGSRIAAMNACRSSATVSAGTPGGATIDRPMSLPLA